MKLEVSPGPNNGDGSEDGKVDSWDIGDSALVFPAASSPNINSRISFDPNIFPMIFDTWPPMTAALRGCAPQLSLVRR